MIKNKVYIKKMKVPTYGSHFWVVVSPSLVRSIDVVEDHIDHKIANDSVRCSARAYTYAYQESNGGYRMIVFVRPTSKPGEIGHEVKHALNLIFRWHGVGLSASKDEHECYMLEWMLNRTHRAISDYPKRIKHETHLHK